MVHDFVVKCINAASRPSATLRTSSPRGTNSVSASLTSNHTHARTHTQQYSTSETVTA